jgi:N-acetylglucosamine-6-phosphate deacetylase
MTTTIQADRVLTPAGWVEPGVVIVTEDGSIGDVGRSGEVEPSGQVVSLEACILAPGLIDVHTHGGHGVTFGMPVRLAEDLTAYSEWVATTGVTGFLCSVAAPDSKSLMSILRAYAAAMAKGTPGAEALGMHLEGPYLSPARRGAFNPRWLRPPSLDEVLAYVEAGEGWVRQMTLAPELPGAWDAARALRNRGVVAALGHSDADFATASAALAGDFTHVTHTFNAQRAFGHREPGVLGAVLASEGVSAELIADKVHVHPAAMKVLVRCLGPDRIVLVTDAMAGAGLTDGVYELVGHQVWVRGGRATLADGTLAGSTAALNECVWNASDGMGVTTAQALRMASTNPARLLGLGARLGAIERGRTASLVALDAEGQVRLTMVRGRVVYQAG